MKKQLSNNLRIATLVMGITLSATVNAQNLLCVILDGDQTNDAIAILQVNKLGIARGALCYLDLTSTTTLENCHAVTGTVTGVQKIKIGLQGVDLLPSTQISQISKPPPVITTSTGAFAVPPTATYTGKGSVATYPSIPNPDPQDLTPTSVQGTATVVRCKATKARRPQEAGNYAITIPASPYSPRTAYLCPSDVAATFLSIPPPMPTLAVGGSNTIEP